MLQYNPLGPYTSPSAYDVPLAPASTTTALRILQDATYVGPFSSLPTLKLSNGAASYAPIALPQPPPASLPRRYVAPAHDHGHVPHRTHPGSSAPAPASLFYARITLHVQGSP